MQEKKAVISVREMAKYLGIGVNVAYELVRRRDFPALRLGEKRIVIPIDLLNEWVKNNVGKV